MKKITPIFVVTLALVLFFNGKKYDELLGSRLTNSVSVCLEGQSCGAASSAAVSSAANSAPIVKVQLSEGSEHIVKMLNSGEGGQMIFEPAVLKVSLGDTIHFKATDAAHNSVSMDVMSNKPDPAHFVRAQEISGIDFQSTLHIGDDAVNDIKGARDLGINTMWFNSKNLTWDIDDNPPIEFNHWSEFKNLLLLHHGK